MSKLRAALYVRISEDRDQEEKGVKSQEEDCREFAATRGYEVVAVFSENDTSAFKRRTITLDSGERVRRVIRPKFRLMLKWLTRNEADAIIAYDLDRVARDPRDLEDLIDAKVLYGFEVHSITGSLRLDTDSDIAMARVGVAMANKASADTARRVARAAKRTAKEGKWAGRPPFGYSLSDQTLHIIPEQASLIEEATQRLLAGESRYAVIQSWNERGCQTKNGHPWTPRTLDRILRNPVIKGVREYRPTLPDGTKAKNPEFEVRGLWKPILSDETWIRLIQVLDSRRTQWTTSMYQGKKRLYPFSGIIRCAKCGIAMTKQGRHYVCVGPVRGRCARRVSFSEITSLTEEAVRSVFAKISVEPHPKHLAMRKNQRSSLQLAESLSEDQKTLDQLDDDHYDGVIDRRTWMRQRSRLVDRISNLQTKYQEQLQHIGPLQESIQVSNVADEWIHRSARWQFEATKLVLQSVLVHAFPQGRPSTVGRNQNEGDNEYAARQRQHHRQSVAQRLEFIWRA